jgi:predicted  nucleic acid-binding Zn-ribbon protein
MKLINIQNTTRALTIAASLVCLGGAFTLFRSDSIQSKTLALNIIIGSGAIAAASHFSSKWCDDSANYQAQKIVDSHESKFKKLDSDFQNLNSKHHKQISVLAEVQSLAERQSQEIVGKDGTIRMLNARLSQLQKEVDTKIAELNTKLAHDDIRFNELLGQFKINLFEDLSDRVYRIYNQLQQSVDTKLGDERYKNVHVPLHKFAQSLEQSYSKHCELLDSIPRLDGNWEAIVKSAIASYSQITDELASLRSKYRNLLNIDERRNLEEVRSELENTYAALADFVPKARASEALSELSQFSTSNLRNLENKIDDNQNSLEEMRGQVADLLDEIDSKNLEIAQLQSQIAELKRPQYWPYASRSDLAMANGIIQYFEKQGIILDRAGSEYHGWNAVLSFHSDRNSNRITLTDLNPHWDKLAPQIHCLNVPVFHYDAESDLFTCEVWLQRKPQKSDQQKLEDFKPTLAGAEEMIAFVREAFHIGLWGSTGQGKTTAISNIIGGMIQSLGGSPKIRLTVPKIDADTQKIFPTVDWLGVPNSVFGLLEAALEIQYRIHVNEVAFTQGKEISDFEPILFFIDEINAIFTRWGHINEADLDDVLGRFSETLSGDRLAYFQDYMVTELRNYKNEFAKKLLMFIWQTGRSLRVKSLISGQNLQPGSFRIMKNDLNNCSYVALGDAIPTCLDYKVNPAHKDGISKQVQTLQECLQHDQSLKYTALYCPSVGKAYLGALPPPNYYKWDAKSLSPANRNLTTPQNQFTNTETLVNQGLDGFVHNNNNLEGNLDPNSDNIQSDPTPNATQYKAFKRFVHDSKLPKKFQNLGYDALLQLWSKLPKKPDGNVMKTKAYSDVFCVARSNDRKVVSEFIDWLSQEFR